MRFSLLPGLYLLITLSLQTPLLCANPIATPNAEPLPVPEADPAPAPSAAAVVEFHQPQNLDAGDVEVFDKRQLTTIITTTLWITRITTTIGTRTVTIEKSIVVKYAQCGGLNWTGGTECVAGSTCVRVNDWFSQCL